MRRFVAVLSFLTCEIVGQIETTTNLEESTTTSIVSTTTATTTQESFTSSENDEVPSSTIEGSVQLSLSDLALSREFSNDDEILKNIAKEKLAKEVMLKRILESICRGIALDKVNSFFRNFLFRV